MNLPIDFKVTSCWWVFRKKDNEQFNARLVANGYSQNEVLIIMRFFSLVVKYTTIRLLLAIVAQDDLELKQLNVKTIFCNHLGG